MGALKYGFSKDAVVTDPSGVNTHATAVFTASWMSANEASSVIGVSSSFHLPRIRFTLHRAGVSEVLSAPAGGFRWRDRIWIAREIAAWTKFLLKP